jgi:hypothetical protein
MNSPSAHSLRPMDDQSDTTPAVQIGAYEELLKSWDADTNLVKEGLLNPLQSQSRIHNAGRSTWADIVLISVSSSNIGVYKHWELDSNYLPFDKTSERLVTETKSALQLSEYPVQMLVLRQGLKHIV